MKNPFKSARIIFLIVLCYSSAIAQTPELDFRFADPTINIDAMEVCYNIEVQADQDDLYLDVMNIRIFVDKDATIFNDFRDLNPGFKPLSNNLTQTLVPGAGQSFFGFQGDGEYVAANLNAIDKNISEDKRIATSPNWTYLLKSCFHIADSLQAFNKLGKFCPPLVWNQDADGDGFSSGSIGNIEGIESIVFSENNANGISAKETVHHANWEYYETNSDLGPCASELVSTHKIQFVEEIDIKLAPNPAGETLNFQVSSNDQNLTQLEIYDSYGKCILKLEKDNINSFSNSENSLDISNLVPGIYFLKLSNNKIYQTKRFVKQ